MATKRMQENEHHSESSSSTKRQKVTSGKQYRNILTHPQGIRDNKIMYPWPQLDNVVRIYVDEAGVGSWAGPLYVTAVYLKPAFQVLGVHDSKLLKEHERHRLYESIIHDANVIFHTEKVSNEVIDASHVWMAWDAAVKRAIETVYAKVLEDSSLPVPSEALVDGRRHVHGLSANITLHTATQADRKYLGVGVASIIAKHSRDMYMSEIAPHYPAFQKLFQDSKGYMGKPPTHRNLIEQGIHTELHRKTYDPFKSWLARHKQDHEQNRANQ